MSLIQRLRQVIRKQKKKKVFDRKIQAVRVFNFQETQTIVQTAASPEQRQKFERKGLKAYRSSSARVREQRTKELKQKLYRVKMQT